MRVLFSLLLMSFSLFAGLPSEGFVTYSKGNRDARTLTIRKISGGKLQPEQTITKKGSVGGDIEGVISYDGKFLAFARRISHSSRGDNYSATGEVDDYHNFDAYDIYVVPLDGGFPATAKKVGHGYFPSWGDDSYNATKTLYFSHYDDHSIYKATISSSGDASGVGKYFTTPTSEKDLHMQASPDGKKVAFREGGSVYIYHNSGSLKGSKFNVGSGCHPSWTAGSHWLMHAARVIARDDKSWHDGLSGSGNYHYGSSQDIKYVIFGLGHHGSEDWKYQNEGYKLVVYSVSASYDAFNVNTSDPISPGEGNFPDIHSGATASPDVSINNFTADPKTITKGSSTTLSWSVSGATAVYVNDEAVSGNSVSKSPSSTTTYTLKVEGQGGPKTKTVTVEVAEPKLTSIVTTPTSATLALGKSETFTATPKDQSGNDFSADIKWKLTGAGKISTTSGKTVKYTAPSDEAGAVTLTASSGGIESKITVTVIDPAALHLKINSGGSDVGDWKKGTDYLTSGDAYNFGSTPSNIGELGSPADKSVYSTVVHLDHTYKFSNVPNGDYTVRIHFYDPTGDTNRKMNYSINGKSVISNMEIAKESGGSDKAVIKEFKVTVSDGKGITIVATKGDGNDVFESAIEIIGTGSTMAANAIVFKDDLAGKNFNTGDEIAITWKAGGDISSVVVEISLDDGIEFTKIIEDGSIGRSSDSWGNYKWKVPESIGNAGATSTTVKIKLTDYSNAENSVTSKTFSLNSGSATLAGKSRVIGMDYIGVSNGMLKIERKQAEPLTVKIYSLSGRLLQSQFFGTNERKLSVKLPFANNGVMLVRLISKHSTVTHRLIVGK